MADVHPVGILEPRGEPHRLMSMRQLAVGILATWLLLSGCSAASIAGDEPSRAQTAATEGKGDAAAGDGNSSLLSPTLDAKWRGTMTVTPGTASPGQSVALHFRSTNVRGIAFSLSAWGKDGWTLAYYLTSDWGTPTSHNPDWWSVEDGAGRAWVDVGVGGPGPDHVIVPDTAPAGEYLLCTANSAGEACAVMTVTG